MILLLQRHGVAEDATAESGYDDAARALTEDGRQRMERAADGMFALGLSPDLVLTSPLVRCRQTADIVASRLGADVEESSLLAPGMSLSTLAEALGPHLGLREVLVCGHQPDLSQVAGDLVGGGRIEFRKGALAVLEVAEIRPVGGFLRALHPPLALRRLGGE